MSHEQLISARRLFPFTSTGRIYLNHAAISPLSTRVVDGMTAHLRDRSAGKLDSYTDDVAMMNKTRSLVCRLINSPSPERISLQPNTSEALNVVTSGLQWEAGDHVLLSAVEFPANVYPYLNLRKHGVEIDFFPSADGVVTAQYVESRLTPRTKLFALSAVQFLSGYRADLQAIGSLCRSRGVLFVVDAIQAVGAIAVDVQAGQVDALAAGSHKWQTGPHGAGFLYLTEDLQSRIQQSSLGWLAVERPWNFHDYDQPLASSARRYEGGTPGVPSLWGLNAALGTLLEYGIEQIQDHILDLTDILTTEFLERGALQLFSPSERNRRAGIVTCTLPDAIDQNALFERIASRNLTVALREGKFRLSPHFYNSADEMRQAVDIIHECLNGEKTGH
ncbi:MAG: aminotransferase class V-fold PLP-dependent enzyme [Bacteroidetes bacterium]|nr:aminotransferase class V-fold PLP-dependent enzyme [Bacteroidota bacterium]